MFITCSGKFRRESSFEDFERFAEDYDDPKTIFQERFGNRWYTWTHQKREESSFQYSASGFEWREHSNRTDHGTKDWENESDIESDDEPCTVGSSSDRTILGLPPSGPLKLDDVKNAYVFQFSLSLKCNYTVIYVMIFTLSTGSEII